MGSVKETVLYILLGILIAWCINLGLSLALSTDMPVVAVESDSMVPAFHKGDILVLKGVLAEEFKVNDTIVYSVANRTVPIVHRIIKINPDGSFQTKGDANPSQFPFEFSVRPEQIHGKMIFIIPYFGWLKISLTDFILPNIIWVIIIIVIILFIYYRKGVI